MKTPFLSIIIPVYNAGKKVEKIVNQLLLEGFGDFELILINDGSTDDTSSILRKLSSKDSRVILLSQPNNGPSSARNTGLSKASGVYIQFYDADDTIIPGALDIICEAAKKTSTDMLVSGWQIDLPNKKCFEQIKPKPTIVKHSDLIPFTLHSIGSDGVMYSLWNKLFRGSIIRNNELHFREDIRFGEDLIFAFHYMGFMKRLDLIPNVTYIYKVGSEGSLFNVSALDYKYRHINDEELSLFVANIPDSKNIRRLTSRVRRRWNISYWRLIAGSSLSYREKIQRLYGFNKLNPYIALFLGTSVHYLRLFIIKVKSLVQ